MRPIFVRLVQGLADQQRAKARAIDEQIAFDLGAGVEPDVAVSHTREALLEGRDRVIDAAVHWFHAQ